MDASGDDRSEEFRRPRASGRSRTSSRSLRLLAVPWFLWLLLDEDRPIAAGILLAVLGATDWVDGYIARHFDQGSKIGKILDPVADRVLLIAGAVGLLIDGSAPRWVLILVLAREAASASGPSGSPRSAPAGSMCNGSAKRARWR